MCLLPPVVHLPVMPEGEKKIGGASSNGWTESVPLDGIGLPDLPSVYYPLPSSSITVYKNK